MQSAVEADLKQLNLIFAIHRRMDPAIDTTEIAKEIGARIREELDYQREAKHVALYRAMLADIDLIRVPRPWPELSTGRLLTLDWLEGDRMLAHKDDALDDPQPAGAGDVHGLVVSVQPRRRDPRRSASRQLFGVRSATASPAASICSTTAASASSRRRSSARVVDLYNGLMTGDDARIVHAYETWGFKRLSRDLIDTLNIWARFIYGPLMDDRVRTIADGVKPSEYGRRQAFQVHTALKEKGPVTVPREFVLMDRAAIGLGAVFLHLRAELNFYRLFNEAIEDFSVERVAARQARALAAAGLEPAARIIGRQSRVNPRLAVALAPHLR